MRKLICFSLTLLLLFSIVGCSGNQQIEPSLPVETGATEPPTTAKPLPFALQLPDAWDYKCLVSYTEADATLYIDGRKTLTITCTDNAPGAKKLDRELAKDGYIYFAEDGAYFYYFKFYCNVPEALLDHLDLELLPRMYRSERYAPDIAKSHVVLSIFRFLHNGQVFDTELKFTYSGLESSLMECQVLTKDGVYTNHRLGLSITIPPEMRDDCIVRSIGYEFGVYTTEGEKSYIMCYFVACPPETVSAYYYEFRQQVAIGENTLYCCGNIWDMKIYTHPYSDAPYNYPDRIRERYTYEDIQQIVDSVVFLSPDGGSENQQVEPSLPVETEATEPPTTAKPLPFALQLPDAWWEYRCSVSYTETSATISFYGIENLTITYTDNVPGAKKLDRELAKDGYIYFAEDGEHFYYFKFHAMREELLDYLDLSLLPKNLRGEQYTPDIAKSHVVLSIFRYLQNGQACDPKLKFTYGLESSYLEGPVPTMDGIYINHRLGLSITIPPEMRDDCVIRSKEYEVGVYTTDGEEAYIMCYFIACPPDSESAYWYHVMPMAGVNDNTLYRFGNYWSGKCYEHPNPDTIYRHPDHIVDRYTYEDIQQIVDSVVFLNLDGSVETYLPIKTEATELPAAAKLLPFALRLPAVWNSRCTTSYTQTGATISIDGKETLSFVYIDNTPDAKKLDRELSKDGYIYFAEDGAHFYYYKFYCNVPEALLDYLDIELLPKMYRSLRYMPDIAKNHVVLSIFRYLQNDQVCDTNLKFSDDRVESSYLICSAPTKDGVYTNHRLGLSITIPPEMRDDCIVRSIGYEFGIHTTEGEKSYIMCYFIACPPDTNSAEWYSALPLPGINDDTLYRMGNYWDGNPYEHPDPFTTDRYPDHIVDRYTYEDIQQIVDSVVFLSPDGSEEG